MNTNFKNNSRNNSKKPYCKVCHDAGKSESIYTSHCVKTYNINTGKTDTTCPTLNALECRYCYNTGHTVKFCPVLEANKKMDAERARDNFRQQRPQQQEVQVQVQTQNKSKNAFAAFAEEQEDEERQAKQEVQEQVTKQEVQAKQEFQAKQDFPALMGNTRVVQNNNVKSYSFVAAIPADERRLDMLRQQRVQETKQKAVTWADTEDSEDEVEEDVVTTVVVSNYKSFVYAQPSAPVSYTYTPKVYDEDDDW